MSRELEKGTLIIFTLYMGANIINYFFQIMMGRMLSVPDYGLLNALFSILMIAALPSAVFTLAVSKYTTEFSVKNENEKIPYFINKMSLYAGILGIIIIVFIITLSPIIRSFLKIDKPYVLEMLSIAIGLGLIAPVITGGLQGLKKFACLGIFSILTATIKLACSILFIYLGFSLFGIIGALIISVLVSIFYGVKVIKKRFQGIKPQRLHIDNMQVFRFMIISLITSVCLAVFTNIDMLMVKHFFQETDAGLYGSVMQFGKILLYIPSALVMALFPLTAEADLKSGNSSLLLKKSLIYSGAIILIGAAIFILFPQFFVTLLFGQKYINATIFMLPSCLMVIPLGLNTIIMNYSLAINKTKFLFISMIIGTVSDLFFVYYIFHNTIFEILYTLTIIGFLVFISNLIYFYLTYRKSKKYLVKN